MAHRLPVHIMRELVLCRVMNPDFDFSMKDFGHCIWGAYKALNMPGPTPTLTLFANDMGISVDDAETLIFPRHKNWGLITRAEAVATLQQLIDRDRVQWVELRASPNPFSRLYKAIFA